MRSLCRYRKKILLPLIAFSIVSSGCSGRAAKQEHVPYVNCTIDAGNEVGLVAICSRDGDSAHNFRVPIGTLDGYSCLPPPDMQQLLNELVLCRGSQ